MNFFADELVVGKYYQCTNIPDPPFLVLEIKKRMWGHSLKILSEGKVIQDLFYGSQALFKEIEK